MTKKQLFVGVDNGKQGAIVFIDERLKIIKKLIMPIKDNNYDIQILYNLFKDYSKRYKLYVAIEQTFAKPFNGIKSNFIGGYQYGIIQTIMIALDISYFIATVGGWQNTIFKNYKYNNKCLTSKQYSAVVCTELWPKTDWRRTLRCKKIHDGLTDAACLALYAKLKFSEQNVI